MKRHKSNPFLKFIIPMSIGVVILIWLGILYSKNPFLLNLITTGIGLILSIVIVLLIINPLVEYQRKRKWKRLKEMTYKAIMEHISDLVAEVSIHFPTYGCYRPLGEIIDGRKHPNPKAVDAMTELISALRKLPQTGTSEEAIKYYEKIKWDLEEIRSNLIPKVIESSDDQELIEALVEFDNARRNLHNSIIVYKKVGIDIFPNVISLIEKAKRVYSTILQFYPQEKYSQF